MDGTDDTPIDVANGVVGKSGATKCDIVDGGVVKVDEYDDDACGACVACCNAA